MRNLDRKAFAALGPSPGNSFPSPGSAHSLAETVRFLAFSLFGLICDGHVGNINSASTFYQQDEKLALCLLLRHTVDYNPANNTFHTQW